VNLSVLDGWWCEGYRGDNGWAIGAGEVYEDHAYQDEVESTALYDLLEAEIIPLFYERGSDDVPREWTAVMKNSMRTVNASFNTNRQVEEYAKRFYLPCLHNVERLKRSGAASARELAAWRSLMKDHWHEVAVSAVTAEIDDAQPMGSRLPVRATVELGPIPATDVLVEIYHGLLDQENRIVQGETTTMHLAGEPADGRAEFEGEIPCRRSGQRGFTIRVLPRKDDLVLDRFETGLVRWWEVDSGASAPGAVTEVDVKISTG
jgi:starch phosphorylase